jgi:transcriptional regulator with XRE-family HTH domain
MQNLALFIGMVRDAQEIRQAKLAEMIEVSQSAINRFENLKLSLSDETIIKMAPILNLNPEYIEKRSGNPFRQVDPQKIIKMLFPEDRLGTIDFTLVNIIATTNEKAVFFFLQPSFFSNLSIPSRIMEQGHPARKEITQWSKQRRKGESVYALFIEDDDNNSFLFKRKNNLLFNENDVALSLREIEAKDRKYFEIQIISMGFDAFQNIRNWSDALGKDFIEYIQQQRHFVNRAFILRLVNEIWTRTLFVTDQRGYEKIRSAINEMDEAKLNRLLKYLIPKLAKDIKEEIH